MRKKVYKALTGIIIILGILGIWYFANSREEISIYSEGVFCFDGLSMGCSEEFFLKNKKNVELAESRQGVYGEERIYAKEFKSDALNRDVVAYYYFDDSGFQRGIYEIAFNLEEKEQVFDTAYEFFERELAAANESINFNPDFNRQFSYIWGEQELQAHKEVYFTDQKDNVYHMEYYLLPDMEQKQHVLEIEIYKDNGWDYRMTDRWDNNWPKEVEVCWNVEVDGNESHLRNDINYLPQRMDIIRIAEGELWAMNRESGELVHYELAEDCIIEALLNPACRGEISIELLAEAERDNYRRDWIMGLNEQGEIEHLYEAYLP